MYTWAHRKHAHELVGPLPRAVLAALLGSGIGAGARAPLVAKVAGRITAAPLAPLAPLAVG